MRNRWAWAVLSVVLASSCHGLRPPGVDGGETDAGAQPLHVLTLAASMDDEQRVRLVWDAGEISSPISILRDGQLIATVQSVSTYDDLDASPGALGGFDAGASIGLPAGIELEWSVPTSEPGVLTTYRLRATIDGGVLESNEAIGRRSAPAVTEWTVEADGSTWTIPASQTRWLDTSAPLPIVVLGNVSATATPSDETSSVVLSADASVQRTLVPVTYTVTARPSSGAAAFATVTGERGGLRPEYQWQRSTADSRDAGWVDLAYVHGRLWFDADAVFNEGRHYRVIVRAGTQERISDEPRALLRRPRALGARAGFAYVQREDGLVVGMGGFHPSAQFEPSAQFVVTNHGACVLLSDAGVECLEPFGAVLSAGLQPVTRIYEGDRLCGSMTDGGIRCVVSFSPGATTIDVPALVSVLDSKGSLICGERPADAGVHCMSTIGPSFDVSPRPLALSIIPGTELVIASFPTAVTVFPSGSAADLPVEDAGYIHLSAGYSTTCGVRADGELRCGGPAISWGASPPYGIERFERYEWGCGLTREHRVRCNGLNHRSLPPPPPVRQVSVLQEASFLLENGLITGRGRKDGLGVGGVGPAPEDRFIQLPVNFEFEQCGLRVDRSGTCWGSMAPMPPPAGRYSKIVWGSGLRLDGGVDSWSGTTNFSSATELVEFTDNVCGRMPDGSWTCRWPLPVPLPARNFTSVVSHTLLNVCALEDGKVDCWPDPPPAHARGRRYRSLSGSYGTTCGLTVEGEVICWHVGPGTPPAFEIPWDDFVTFEWGQERACGVRRDGTAPCVGVYTPPWE